MNKNIYKLVWSDDAQGYVAVSEYTAAKGKRSSAAKMLLAAAMFSATAATAAPPLPVLAPGGNVTGSTISTTGQVMNIDTGAARSIHNWNSFDIGTGYTVNINQPGASSVSLNRVVQSNVSNIFGTLNSNGQVYLINPNGVIFGNGSVVNVQGIVASTLGITDEVFLEQTDQGFLNKTFAAAVVDGTTVIPGDITVSSGAIINGGKYAALLAPNVLNEGTIVATNVAMLAGDNIVLTLDPANSDLVGIAVDSAQFATLVTNRGAVVAENGAVWMSAHSMTDYAAAVINAGPVNDLEKTNLIELSDGVIGIRATSVNISAQNDAGTASVSLSGPDSTIEAVTVQLDSAGEIMLAGHIEATDLTAVAGGKIYQPRDYALGTYLDISNQATFISFATTAEQCQGYCVDLGNIQNDFNYLNIDVPGLNEQAGDAYVADRNGLSINANVRSLTVDANMYLEEHEHPGDVVLANGVDNAAGFFYVATDLAVNSNGGNILQNGALNVGGTSRFDATRFVYNEETYELTEEERGDILLCNPGNQLTSYVSLLGNDIVLTNGKELNLARVEAGAMWDGERAVDATGRVNISTTVGNLNVWGPVVTTYDEGVAVVLAAGTSRGVYDRVRYNGVWLPTANEPVYDVIFRSAVYNETGPYVEGNANTKEAYIQTGLNATWQIYSDGPTQQDHSKLWWITNPELLNTARGSLGLDGVGQPTDAAYYAAVGLIDGAGTFHPQRYHDEHGGHGGHHDGHHDSHEHDDEEHDDHHHDNDHYFDTCCNGYGGLTAYGNGIFYRINPVDTQYTPYRYYQYPVGYQPDQSNQIQAPVDVESDLIDDGADGDQDGIEKNGGFTSVEPLGTLNVVAGTGFQKQVPAETFSHSDPNAEITYSATLADGKPLPSWVKFDPSTLTVQGTPPKGESSAVVIKVIATDQRGDTASTILTIKY